MLGIFIPNVGDDELPDEVMLQICSFIGVRELGRLECVSQRFAEKSIAAPSGGGEPAAAALEMLSLAEEAARRWVAGCSEQERGWVPRLGGEMVTRESAGSAHARSLFARFYHPCGSRCSAPRPLRWVLQLIPDDCNTRIEYQVCELWIDQSKLQLVRTGTTTYLTMLHHLKG